MSRMAALRKVISRERLPGCGRQRRLAVATSSRPVGLAGEDESLTPARITALPLLKLWFLGRGPFASARPV